MCHQNTLTMPKTTNIQTSCLCIIPDFKVIMCTAPSGLHTSTPGMGSPANVTSQLVMPHHGTLPFLKSMLKPKKACYYDSVIDVMFRYEVLCCNHKFHNFESSEIILFIYLFSFIVLWHWENISNLLGIHVQICDYQCNQDLRSKKNPHWKGHWCEWSNREDMEYTF